MMNSLHKTLTKTSPLRLSALSLSSNYYSTQKNYCNQIGAQKYGAVISEENPKIDGDIPGRKNWARPSEIVFQSKVANLVNLIGTIQTPVQFVTSADGKSWAGTVFSQDQRTSDLPLWIPITFEGDLAHTAATHIKVRDPVHVAGQLSRDPLPIKLTDDKVDVQLKVHDIHFVRGYPHKKKYIRK